jgi:hypothetical protein
MEKLANHHDWDTLATDIPRLRAMLMEVAKGAEG